MHRAFQAARPAAARRHRRRPRPPRLASSRLPNSVSPIPPDVTDANPILRAARPLMVLLANLALPPDHASVVPMMDEIANAIVRFERDLGSPTCPGTANPVGQIRDLRHRRRHRAEPARQRPAVLDPIQHAEPLLRRHHQRRRLLSRSSTGPRPIPPSITTCWN